MTAVSAEIIPPDKRPLEHGLLFFGNAHETVPVRLLYDPYLTARAKFAWLLIKNRAKEFQGSLFPSYKTLGHLLSDKAYNDSSLSRKIITQTLLLLRLTRWLTLCKTVRNAKGQVIGNVYLLHDEPMPILDTLQLNDDYLSLLEKSAKHRDPAVSGVASHIIGNLLTDKSQWHYLSHVDWIKMRYQAYKDRPDYSSINYPSEHEQYLHNIQETLLTSDLSSDWELGQLDKNPLSSQMELSQKSNNSLSSNMELSQKMNNSQSSDLELSKNHQSSQLELRHQNSTNPLISGLVPNRNSATQYSTSTVYINKYCTGQLQELDWSPNLTLTDLEKQVAAKAMKGLDLGLCKAILFEAEQRIAKGDIKKPQSYLHKLIQRAQKGEFNPYLYQQESGEIAVNKATTTAEAGYLNWRTPPVNAATHCSPTFTHAPTDHVRAEQIRQFKSRLLNR